MQRTREPDAVWQCGRLQLPLGGKTYLMAILNVTPDSFSGDGVTGRRAIDQALKCVEAGCDILDIGGESTRPYSGLSDNSLEESHQQVPGAPLHSC